MLKFDDLYEEIEAAELGVKTVLDASRDSTKDTPEVELLAILIKLSTLNLKLLHNIRANQSKTMVAQGVKKIEAKTGHQPEKR